MKTTVIKPRQHFGIDLHEIWEYKELFYFLTWRDIKVRYKQTAIGILWALLQPLLTMIIFTLFFGKSFSQGIGGVPYAIFAYTGLIFWNYFSASLNSISMSFFANKTIITKVFFPRIIIPVSSAIVPIVDFFFAFLLLIPLLLFFHIVPSVFSVGVIFLCVIFSFLISISLGLGLAIVNVKYRDIQYAIPFFIQLLLFVSPVIYPISILPKQFQLLLYINPMTAILQLVQNALFHTTSINMIGVGISTLVTVLAFCASYFVYQKYEAYIADIV